MKLPPLNALRAFEAAARTGSFTAAGRDIGVSSAAVSQQVRNLEDYLGRQLFFRNNNRLQLTDAGRELYENAAVSLQRISSFTADLLAPAGRRPLTLSVIPSLAHRWLPRILSTVPDQPCRLRVEDDPVDMEGQGIDLRLTYGGATYPGFWVQPLFYDRLVPMAAPSFARDLDARSVDLSQERLVELDWGPSFGRAPTWAEWCLKRGLAAPLQISATVPGGAVLLDMLEAGVGLGLGQLVLARDALAQGRLKRLSAIELPLAQPYVAVTSHARLQLGRVTRLLDALGTASDATPLRAKSE